MISFLWDVNFPNEVECTSCRALVNLNTMKSEPHYFSFIASIMFFYQRVRTLGTRWVYCINCSFPIFFLLHTNNRVSCIKKINLFKFVFFQFVFALGNIVNRSEIKDHYSNETSELHLIFFLLCMFSRATNETKCIRKRSELLMGKCTAEFLLDGTSAGCELHALEIRTAARWGEYCTR